LSVDVTFMMYSENNRASISITVQIRAVLAVIPSCSGENLHQHTDIRQLQPRQNTNNDMYRHHMQTARHSMSVDILSTAEQLYEKLRTKRPAVGE